MPPLSSATTLHDRLDLEVANPSRKSRVLASTKSESYDDTVAPSVLLMRLSTASPAASVRFASSIASRP
jgi:hypothetical protein